MPVTYARPMPDFATRTRRIRSDPWQFLGRFETETASSAPRRLDWLAVAILTLGLGAELVFGDRDSLALEAIIGLAIIAMVPFRRPRPLLFLGAAVALSSGWVVWQSVVRNITLQDGDVSGTSVGLAIVIMAYTVFRWEPVRRAGVGFVVLVASGIATDLLMDLPDQLGSAVGTFIAWAFVAAVAAAMRYRSNLNQERLNQARLQER